MLLKIKEVIDRVTLSLIKHNNLTAFAAYTIISAVMVYPIFMGKTNIFIDQLLHIPPMYSWWRDQVLSGVIPLWNPHVLLGLPFAADPAHPAFSPFNLVFIVFENPYQASNALLLILLTISALGARQLGLAIGLRQTTALVIGLFYGLSGSVLESAGDLNSLVAISLTPWMIWAVWSDLNKSDTIMLRTIFVIWLMLISGHSQYIYYNLIFSGGLTLFVMRKNLRLLPKVIASWIISLILTLGLAAFQVFPTLELISNTSRSDNIGYENIHGTTWTQLPRFIFPQIYGQRNAGNSWGIQADVYTGLAGIQGFVSLSVIGLCLLSILSISKSWRVWRNFLILGVLASLVIGLGPETQVFKLLYEYFPGMSQFRSPSRALVLYSLCLSLLAGISLEHSQKPNKKIIKLVIGLGLTIGLTSLLGYLLAPSLFLNLLMGSGWISDQSSLPSIAYPLVKLEQISQLIWSSGFIFGVGLIGWQSLLKLGRAKSTASKLLGLGMAACFLLAEAFVGLRGDFIWAPIHKISASPEIVNQLKSINSASTRFIALSDIVDYVGIWPYFNHLRVMDHMMPDSPLDRSEFSTWQTLEEHLSVLPANTHLLHGLYSAGGYVAIIPQNYRTYWQSKKVNSLDYQTIDDTRIDDFGISYLTTRAEFDYLESNDSFELLTENHGVRLYRNLQVKKRVSLIAADGLEVQLSSEVNDVSTGHLRIEIDDSPGGILIVRDFNYPGWQATVNGTKAAIAGYKHIFRSLEVPAGPLTIEMKYQPKSFALGIIVSAISLTIYLFVLRRKLAQ